MFSYCWYVMQYPTLAAAGHDFENTSQSLVVPPGPAGLRVCADITIIEDRVLEDEETFSVVLDSSDPSVGVSPNVALVIILDNDGEYVLSYVSS